MPEVGDLLQHIDIIVMPEGFLTAFTGCAEPGAGLRALTRRFQPAIAIVTLGGHGSLARCGDTEIRTPGFAVEVRDTTGAGDAFRGGLAAAWAHLGDRARVEEVLACANATAALNCRGIGAQQGLPVWEDVRSLVTRPPGARSNQAGSPDVGTTE
jgi:sugar/nucleoside kinase (ribokinase family)